jgi:hypothetical protein
MKRRSVRRYPTYEGGPAVLFLVLLNVDRVNEDTRVDFGDQLAKLNHPRRSIRISWKRVESKGAVR